MPWANGEVLLQRLEARLGPELRDALSLLVAEAEADGAGLYLVGGTVRDLLLERDHVDLDLALEGDAEVAARALAARTNGRVVLHPRFGTATVMASGFTLDLSRTRRETYPRPGSMPVVEPASLQEDLARRDFTINAMALRLTRPAGEVIDPFGGRDHLQRRLLRVLHEASFRDDATRMLRGVRYVARLRATFEPQTEAWLRRDLAYLDTISGARLRRELALTFAEPTAAEAMLLARGLGVLEAMLPRTEVSEAVAERWRAALQASPHAALDELGFCVLIDPHDAADVQRATRRLHLFGRIEEALRGLVRLKADSAKLAVVADSPAVAVDLLDGYRPASVWALGVLKGGPIAAACEAYLGQWRKVRPLLRGNDLAALGLSGPALGEALQALRRARLEGRVQTREDEERLVRAAIAGKGAS